ncbi:hypothetical protein BV25DRAFT_1819150 [Artomyces pyxidatus]|uniref:Uncharacterized protein n=1 Tax=Artomyces pyxidatus TaxID=48021 RepID=A0ACB8TH47_9AGAM|nr:hypothetical protein BV25DRAFT_1819150 [Artomyces pyxidatus]
MSLADLTRNSFQSGISPAKWAKLCALFLSKQSQYTAEDSERAISNSVLVLFSSYPGDSTLQGYIREAIQQGLLSLAIFVATFLQAARSPELHNATTLDTLCRIAVESPLSSASSSATAALVFSEGADAILSTIRDALVLLRTAYTLPTSHFHRLLESVGELLMVLLNTFMDSGKCSSTQAIACIDDAKGILQLFPLNQDVREALEHFVVSLTLVAEEDPTATREVQMMHNIQSSLAKGDVLAPGSDTDEVSCGLILYHLVLDRSKNYGSGDTAHATALLVATFRVTSRPVTKFYAQLFLSAIEHLLQDLSHVARMPHVSLWRSFVIGRFPRLLVSFEKALETDGANVADLRMAIRDAWGSISLAPHTPHILLQYESALSLVGSSDQTVDTADRVTFTRLMTQQLMSVGLIDQVFAARVDPALGVENMSRLQSEAREAGVDLESYLGYRLSPDSTMEDTEALLVRVYTDFSSHSAFAELVRKRFTTLSANFDVDTLSHLARILYNNEAALDIVSLHIKISDLVVHALAVLEDYDCETVGDPQTAVSHLGDIVIFLQVTATRYNLPRQPQTLGNRKLDPNFLRTTNVTIRFSTFSPDQRGAFSAWFKALFDKNSEGIEDGILRSTRPKALLAMAATLCCSAVSACAEHKIDPDTLSNGISYFLGPLLNWTLLGIVQALCREIRLTRFQSFHHLNVLRTLLLSPSFPPPVLRLCGLSILRLLSTPQLQRLMPKSFDLRPIRTTVRQALGWTDQGSEQDSLSLSSQIHWPNQPHHAVQSVLAQMRSGKPPTIDVSACVHASTPTHFLQLLWLELSAAPSVGTAIDAVKRFAVFVLTTPRTPRTPPLLPIFLHNVFPSLMDTLDQQPTASQSVNAELLVTIVSSTVMTALHLERAVLLITGEQRFPLGEPSTAMARGLAADLRHRKNRPTAKLIAQRLASSATFVASFPVFKTEI